MISSGPDCETTLFSSLPSTSSSAILPSLAQRLALFVCSQLLQPPSYSSPALAQYRSDLLPILLGTALFPITRIPLSHPANHAKLPAIHTKAEVLMAALVMVTAPASSIRPTACSEAAGSATRDLGILALSLHLPGRKAVRTKDEKLQLLVKLEASQPHPTWGLQVQACLSSGVRLPTSLLTQMGAFQILPVTHPKQPVASPGTPNSAVALLVLFGQFRLP